MTVNGPANQPRKDRFGRIIQKVPRKQVKKEICWMDEGVASRDEMDGDSLRKMPKKIKRFSGPKSRVL